MAGGVGAAVEPDGGDPGGRRHVQRPGVGADEDRARRGRVQQPGQVLLAQVLDRPALDELGHAPRPTVLARAPSPEEHRPEPEVGADGVQGPGPALHRPVLGLGRRAQVDAQHLPAPHGRGVAAAPLLREGEGPLPHHRHAQVLEEFVVLVLDVAAGARRDPVGREPPVQVGRPAAVEAQLHRGVQQGRHQPRLEVAVQVEDQVERQPARPPPELGMGRRAQLPPQRHEPVDHGVPRHQPVEVRLHDPRQLARRPPGPERRHHRQHAHQVAHGAEADQGDPRAVGVEVERGHGRRVRVTWGAAGRRVGRLRIRSVGRRRRRACGLDARGRRRSRGGDTPDRLPDVAPRRQPAERARWPPGSRRSPHGTTILAMTGPARTCPTPPTAGRPCAS